MSEDNIQFLNTNKYPFKKRVFIEGEQVLMYAERKAISLDFDYEDMLDSGHIILLLSGNTLHFFGINDVIISNDTENNNHALLIAYDDIMDMVDAEAKHELYKSCEFCIDGYITTITKTETALVIMCFEAPLEFESDKNPGFPVLLSCEAPTTVQQLSYNTAKKDVITTILLNDHTPPVNIAIVPDSKKPVNIEKLHSFTEALVGMTNHMGIHEGHWYMVNNQSSDKYQPEQINRQHVIVRLKELNIVNEGDNTCVIETASEYVTIPLIEFLLDITCVVIPDYTLVCTPTRAYMITMSGETDFNIDINSILFEVSEDESEEERRNQERKFIFHDFLNDHLPPSKEGFLIGVMFDKDGNMIYYSHNYVHPDDGTTKPTEIRITQ